ncbi:MAG: hypothetical protein H6830_03410 [Planctomycetes bacterium]|nr:hypothetical protein [Planctomycetota bacterium]MCB9910660.1 hypothetical protein [Planctomycetota bacterium]
MLPHSQDDPPSLGILAALEPELAPLLARAERQESVLGCELWRLPGGGPWLVVTGVGKVAAAHGTAALLTAGASGVLLVGTGGGVSKDLAVGDLVHASECIQADLAVREGRHNPTHGPWRTTWLDHAGGREGLILSSDRPVMDWTSRRRLRMAYSGTLLADMEAAACAAVCARAGRPFAALKVVTDRAGLGARREFGRHFGDLGGAAARTLLAFCSESGQWLGADAFSFLDGSGRFSG